jgi:4-hydroxy-3-polyprenylbenzoate decarboxylase
MSRPIVVGLTGASGACYAQRLLEVLLAASRDVLLSISPAGAAVIKEELGLTVDLENFDPKSLGLNLSGARTPGSLTYYHYQDLMSPIASGSHLTGGMVVCPCSGGTLSGIVNAASQNLIQRAADVHLKERRKLILVPRETPLSSIQLDNMKRAAEAGAVVLPAMPGFYHGAKTIRDLVDFIVARICDQLGVEHQLMKRWGSE